MFKYASSKPSKKKIKGKCSGESEWAERVSTRCFHLTNIGSWKKGRGRGVQDRAREER
jgi:hypothetical protein